MPSPSSVSEIPLNTPLEKRETLPVPLWPGSPSASTGNREPLLLGRNASALPYPVPGCGPVSGQFGERRSALRGGTYENTRPSKEFGAIDQSSVPTRISEKPSPSVSPEPAIALPKQPVEPPGVRTS